MQVVTIEEIKVKGLIVATCKPGAEESACYEIGDLLFHHDMRIEVEKAKFPGVVVVRTSMDSYEAFKIILSNITSYTLKAYPLASLERVLELVAKLPGREKLEVSLRCELRGRREECPQAMKTLANMLESAGVKLGRRSKYALHIQGVGRLQGYSLLPSNCENLSKVYESEKLRSLCLDFVSRVLG